MSPTNRFLIGCSRGCSTRVPALITRTIVPLSYALASLITRLRVARLRKENSTVRVSLAFLTLSFLALTLSVPTVATIHFQRFPRQSFCVYRWHRKPGALKLSPQRRYFRAERVRQQPIASRALIFF